MWGKAGFPWSSVCWMGRITGCIPTVGVMAGVLTLETDGNEKLTVLEVGSVRAEMAEEDGAQSDSEWIVSARPRVGKS